MLKGIFKDSHPAIQLLMMLVFIFSGALAGQLLGMFVIFMKYGFSIEIVQAVMSNMVDYPVALRELQFFSALGTFIFPAIVLGYLFSDNYKDYLKIDAPIRISPVVWVILSMIVVLPFLNFIAYYNQQIHFPEYLKPLEERLRLQEETAENITRSMLNMENLWALILNTVVVGLFAAVGEEFIFRGILQNVFGKFLRNKHVIIWTVAIIFSLAHFQFFGFVPRVLLGAYFGYLVYFTNNIWIPVIAHFTHNFIIVMSFWVYKEQPEKLDDMDAIGTGPSWWMALISLIFFIAVFRIIQKQSQLQNLSS
ncbi:CPBP family intramembrane metalloprotease [Bacteroidales bacterium OttesenSCG-928-A17]|nr:CPBP family intramembrane metalloprotease [Bacteroidales bacterium OttesenSCG-928-A17]